MSDDDKAGGRTDTAAVQAKRQTNRRRFLRTVLLTAASARRIRLPAADLIRRRSVCARPAPSTKGFPRQLHQKCGQCVQVCPVQAIKLADLIDGMGVGAPIDARQQACDFSCDAVQCVLACPTGTLSPHHKPEFLTVRPGAALAAKPILLAREGSGRRSTCRSAWALARLTRPKPAWRSGQRASRDGRAAPISGHDALHGCRQQSRSRSPCTLQRPQMTSAPANVDRGAGRHRASPGRQQAQVAGRA